MARKFGIAIDLNQNELRNAALQNLSAAPSSPVVGQTYFDTTLSYARVWNGTVWQSANAGTAVQSVTAGDSTITTGGTATAPTVKVAKTLDHTYVTDFDTQVRTSRLDQMAAPTAAVPLNSQKITGLANGTASTDAAAFGQIPTALPPNGSAGGDLTGTYPNPTLSGTSNVNSIVRASRLDQMAAPTASVSLNSQLITNLLDPVNPQDAATKNYVDVLSQGVTWKKSVAAATTSALPANTYANGSSGVGATLTGNANGALAAIDGITLTAGQRDLVKNEATAANNGIYTVTQVGDGTHPYILTRVTEMDSALKIEGAAVLVESGTTNINQGWIVDSAGPYTVGTTAITFTQFTGVADITAGTGLTKSGNTIQIDAAYVGQTSITTLGTIATGTWSGTAIAVNKGGTGATSAAGARTALAAATVYAVSFGDGAATSYTITHNMGTKDVAYKIWTVSGGAEIEFDVTNTDTNTLTVVCATAPTSNQYRIVVVGLG